ncbi:MAG: hypothetical protein E7H61_05135 [Pantoea sp.]|nr:hypothetical protein [Pantoea sp.]
MPVTDTLTPSLKAVRVVVVVVIEPEINMMLPSVVTAERVVTNEQHANTDGAVNTPQRSKKTLGQGRT